MYSKGADAALSNESSRRFLHCCRIAVGPVYLWNRYLQPQKLWWRNGDIVSANMSLFRDIEQLRAETRCAAVYIILDISPQLLIFRVTNVETHADNGDSASAEHAGKFVPDL